MAQAKEIGIVDLPDCPEYFATSELRSKLGCYPNISAEHIAHASRLREMIEDHDLMDAFHRCDPDEIEFLKLLRFLRARKWDPAQAMAMIVADLEWRKEDERMGLRWETASEVLEDVDLNKLYTFYPTWIQGHCKQYRPVSYRQFGKFEVWNVLELTTFEKLLQFHVWEMEQLIRYMHDNSKKTGCNIETFVVIVDVAGWSLKLTTGDAFALAKAMANTDSDHYPERLGTMLLINAPGVLSFAWRIIQTFLDDVQKAKIKIMGADPKEWQPVLFDLIDRDQVPQIYGGFAPNPTSETAFASMNPPLDTASAIKHRKGKPKTDSRAMFSLSPQKNAAKNGSNGSLNGTSTGASEKKTQGLAVSRVDQRSNKPFPWYHNICQVPLCKDGDDDFDFIVHFNSAPGDRRPVIEAPAEKRCVEMSTQTDDFFLQDVTSAGANKTGCGACAVM